MSRSRARYAWVAVAGLGTGAVSCKAPAEVRIEASTDVAYADGLATAFTVGRTTKPVESADPVAVSAERWSKRGFIGSLVSIPGAQKDGPLVVKLVMGVARDVSECKPPDYDGCIVARRRLRYVPGTQLRLPIKLHLRCENVPCDASSTCNYLGRCIPSLVDQASCESPDGCTLPGESDEAPDVPVAEPNDAGDRGDAGDGGDAAASLEGGVDGGAGADGGDDGGSGPGPTGAMFAVGNEVSCYKWADGRLKCWGRGEFGQLASGDGTSRGVTPAQMGAGLPFVALGSGRTARSIAARGRHVCAVLDNGDVKCWGANDHGQLGQGTSVTPIGTDPNQTGDNLVRASLGTARRAKVIATGPFTTCAILDDDRLKCWGANDSGQLGLGDQTDRGTTVGQMGDALPYVDLGVGRRVKAVGCGASHTCAILDNDRIKCWGIGAAIGLGQSAGVGSNPGEMGDALPYVDLGTGRTALILAVGDAHTCALLDGGIAVKCWGNTADGEVGLSDTAPHGDDPGEMGNSLPAVDLGLEGVVWQTLVAGTHHSCVGAESIKCWGRNGQPGVLGLGDTVNRGDGTGAMGDGLPFVNVGAQRKVRRIAAGATHTCAILDDESVKCWGSNNYGELGVGDTQNRGANGQADMGDALPTVSLGN